MTFIDYYQNLPDLKSKRQFRKKIIEVCRIEHSTFYTWIYRKIIPALAQKTIAEIMDKPQTELFPEIDKFYEQPEIKEILNDPKYETLKTNVELTAEIKAEINK